MVVAYLTSGGTAPWIIGGALGGVFALAARTRANGERSSGFVLVAIVAFAVAGVALVLLAASKYCEGAGGCMH